MVTMGTGQRLNGMDVDELRKEIDSVRADAAGIPWSRPAGSAAPEPR